VNADPIVLRPPRGTIMRAANLAAHVVTDIVARASRLLALVLILGVFGLVVSDYLADAPFVRTLVALSALLAALFLALIRYETAVALGFLLLGVVLVEPAPSDGIFAAVALVALLTGRLDFRRVPLSMRAAIGVFLFLNVLSAINAVSPGRAGRFMLITLYLLTFGVWLTTYIRNEERARKVFKYYLVAAGSSAALGVLALFVPFPHHELLTYAGGAERAKGLFKDPNVFGPFLIPALLILLEDLVTPRLRIRRLWSLVLLTILGLGVVFAYSRSGWLSVGVGVVVLFGILGIRPRGATRFLFGATMVLLVLSIAGMALALSGSLGFLEERGKAQSYDAQRFETQREGLEVGLEHPLGVGPGQFEFAASISAHSIYVRAIAEYGVAGLAALLVLLLGTLILAVRNAFLGRNTYGIGSAALLAAWCGLLANSIFVDTLHWRHLWLVAALIWAGTRSYPARTPEFRLPALAAPRYP
jgi:hypothetical protein